MVPAVARMARARLFPGTSALSIANERPRSVLVVGMHLTVLCYGHRPSMREFARTWPKPMKVLVDYALSNCNTAQLNRLLDVIEQLAQRWQGDFSTLILDLAVPSTRGEATGPVWRDEHWRFFRQLVARWYDRQILILAPERRVADIEALNVDARPDVSPALSDLADVVLRFTNAVTEDPLLPSRWGRCERHRMNPRLSGTLRTWDAASVLDKGSDNA